MMTNFRWFFWIVALASLCSQTFAATYYVSPSGSDSQSGSLDSPWRSLQYAENQLSSGDILVLRGGEYNETVTINVPNVTVKNYPGETPVIDGEFNYPQNVYEALLQISADNVTIDGINVTRSKYRCVNANTCKYATIKNCTITFCDDNNIKLGYARQDGYNTVDNCVIKFGNYCWDRGTCGSWGNIGSNIGIQGRYNTVKNSTVAYGRWAGVEGYMDEYATIENNIIYGNGKTQIHEAKSRYAIIRNNLIYGTTRPDVSDIEGYGVGVALQTELWYDGSGWDTGHEVYGNMIANTGIGIQMDWGKGPEPWHEDNNLSNCLIYNNTIVEPQTNSGTSWFGYAVVINNSTHLGTGNVFKNNIIWQTNGSITSGSVDSSKVDIGYNLWNKTPASSFMRSTDPTYPNYNTLSISDYFSKISGWGSIGGGSLTGKEFNLLSTAEYAIDSGTDSPVASPSDEFLDLSSSNYINRNFSFVNQGDYQNWEVGAGVYVGGASPPVSDDEQNFPPPTFLIIGNK
jgi:hypothetical protein